MKRASVVMVLPYAALFWPVMLTINHLHLAITTRNAYMGYLVTYPIFIFTDIVTPLLLILLWLEFRYEDHYIHEKLARVRVRQAYAG